MKRSSVILLFIISLFIRLIGQPISPPGFHQDEAAFGYNAYSIYKTGRDEFGHKFPLILESIGDYKSALYSYLIIPFMALLGPTELAVRLPAILFGTCSVVLLYALARAIHFDNKLSVIAGLLVALSPWHILQSRFAAETTVAAFFILAMVFFLVCWYKSQRIKILFSAVACAALAVYTYNSARVTVPLLLFAFLLVAWKRIKTYWEQILFAVISGVVMLLPLFVVFINNFDTLTRRPSAISIFNQAGLKGQLWEETVQDPSDQNPVITRFFHNKIRTYGREILKRYIQHFNIKYLVISGDLFDRFQTPYSGILLFGVFLLALIGVTKTLIKTPNPMWKFILSWIFISPIVSSMSIYTPSSLHTLDQVFPISIFAALGISVLLKQYSLYRFSLLYVAVGMLCVANFLQFLYGYFIILPREWKYSRNWGYGFKEVSEEVRRLSPEYNEFVFFGYLVFDNLAFNLRYDPVLFQSEVRKTFSSDPSLFDHVTQFGKFRFRKDLFLNERLVPGIVYVGLDQSIEMNNTLKELAVITSPDGIKIHRIVTLK